MLHKNTDLYEFIHMLSSTIFKLQKNMHLIRVYMYHAARVYTYIYEPRITQI